MSKTVIYLGPSLDLATARSILDATYLPPIKRGDLAKLGPTIERVAIIDGEFFQSLSISTMEILPFLDRAVKVYGASSIGALRAVETERYGMIGVGEIFEWYRDGIVDADDEVALTFDPSTYRPTSEPLINIRFALRDAVCEDILEQAKATQAIEKIRKVYFPSRSFQLVYQECPEVRQFITNRRPNRKREDALQLLRLLANA
jgi:hypothetical protein